MAKTPDMNADFAGWYADVFMEDGPVRAARWKGVVDTAIIADFRTLEILVRYAFATVAPADGGKNEALAAQHKAVLTSLAGNGPVLAPTVSSRELQVLAAAVLARLFPTMPDSAIAVLNASFGGMRKVDLPMDLTGLASRALVDLSKKKHERPDAKELEVVAPKIDFEVSPEAMGSMAAAQWKGELDRLRDASRTAVRTITDGQNRIARLLARQISLGDEELQMLWWLIGGHSSEAKTSFADVSIAFRPLAFGKELGRLTKVSPGPASVIALLARAGVTDEALKISDTINAADVSWIKEATESPAISPITTPLHFALERRLEVCSDDAWVPAWNALTGLSADATMSALGLAELFYREELFLSVSD